MLSLPFESGLGGGIFFIATAQSRGALAPLGGGCAHPKQSRAWPTFLLVFELNY